MIMKLITVYKKITELNIPVFSTTDMAVVLNVSNKYGSKLLTELSHEGFIFHICRNLWGIRGKTDPFIILDYLSSPMPSYISLQSALYYHGIISQIPAIIYGISVAKTKQYKTAIGTYSLHHIDTDLFFGFDIVGENHIKMAQAEKALFDYFYLKCTKNKLFYALPEVEIPKTFSWDKLTGYVKDVKNKSRHQMILKAIEMQRKKM